MFAMYLSKSSDSSDSEITFGGYDTQRTGSNPMYWEDVADKTAWSVNVNQIIYGDIVITSPRILHFSTGEPYIIMSQSNV